MAFNKGIPTASTSLRVSNPQILENQESSQEAINNEHIFTGTDAGTQTGDHTQGSARCFFKATAPDVRIDTTNFIATDNGSLWINTGDNALSIMTDYSQAIAADKWTLVSDEVIAVLLAANRVFTGTLGVDGDFEVGTGSEFTVSSAGAVTAASTLDVTGATELIGVATIADNSVTKTVAVATAAAEIANLATVDAQVAVVSALLPSGLTDVNDSIGEFSIGEVQVKYGKKTVTGTSGTITFTTEGLTAFDNACFQAYVVGGKSTGGTTQTIQSNTPTATSFKWHSGSAADLSPVRWFAIGR